MHIAPSTPRCAYLKIERRPSISAADSLRAQAWLPVEDDAGSRTGWCRSARSTFSTMARTLPLSACKASRDLWVVEEFTGDGAVRRRTLYRRRWQPRAFHHRCITTATQLAPVSVPELFLVRSLDYSPQGAAALCRHEGIGHLSRVRRRRAGNRLLIKGRRDGASREAVWAG